MVCVCVLDRILGVEWLLVWKPGPVLQWRLCQQDRHWLVRKPSFWGLIPIAFFCCIIHLIPLLHSSHHRCFFSCSSFFISFHSISLSLSVRCVKANHYILSLPLSNFFHKGIGSLLAGWPNLALMKRPSTVKLMGNLQQAHICCLFFLFFFHLPFCPILSFLQTLTINNHIHTYTHIYTYTNTQKHIYTYTHTHDTRHTTHSDEIYNITQSDLYSGIVHQIYSTPSFVVNGFKVTLGKATHTHTFCL